VNESLTADVAALIMPRISKLIVLPPISRY